MSAVNSGAQRHSLQVRQSLGVCKRRSHQSPQAGCPSWFPAPKPRCSEDGFSFSLFLHPVPDQNMFHKCWLNTPFRGKVLQNGRREVWISSDLLSVPGSVLGKGIHSSNTQLFRPGPPMCQYGPCHLPSTPTSFLLLV